jgi:hypothetical protein
MVILGLVARRPLDGEAEDALEDVELAIDFSIGHGLGLGGDWLTVIVDVCLARHNDVGLTLGDEGGDVGGGDADQPTVAEVRHQVQSNATPDHVR